ncbi:hypothetical protein HYH03_011320 [Edaphochlamys debaryana]|uniref:Uncharacterized protein n=1 Tax=Edaphochlamys debaryana TaxID=47281 RepID=A0A835XW81_9CHLO|nr:hypothetical protein HYH03_011320 [Edaphochlamys debaryana]|eukprot:KAG2490193.1 hypothetical protein HYH03_011320 [Edaphochlamys debaryana]
MVPREHEGPFEAFAGSRLLLLDHTHNLHSVFRDDTTLSGGLWDVLATLPSLVPPGPIGMLGLAAGTVPRIIAAHYPCGPTVDLSPDSPAPLRSCGAHNCHSGRLHHGSGGASSPSFPGRYRGASSSSSSPASERYLVHGWELDPAVVAAGRAYLGMRQLEEAGKLVVHVGDALAPEARVPGGFSGIIVDLFAGGRLLPQLTKRSTWEALRSRLAPGPRPRLLANLGQAPPRVPGMRWHSEAYTTLRAYEALEAAFEGDVSLLTFQSNTLALTGPLPAPEEWPGSLPPGLRHLGREGCWERDVYPLQTYQVPLSLF